MEKHFNQNSSSTQIQIYVVKENSSVGIISFWLTIYGF